MERHEILSPDIDWPNLVRHVAKDQVVVELAVKHVPIARIVPVAKSITFSELDHALRQLPPLGDDARDFESDIAELRNSMIPLDDPWES